MELIGSLSGLCPEAGLPFKWITMVPKDLRTSLFIEYITVINTTLLEVFFQVFSTPRMSQRFDPQVFQFVHARSDNSYDFIGALLIWSKQPNTRLLGILEHSP